MFLTSKHSVTVRMIHPLALSLLLLFHFHYFIGHYHLTNIELSCNTYENYITYKNGLPVVKSVNIVVIIKLAILCTHSLQMNIEDHRRTESGRG